MLRHRSLHTCLLLLLFLLPACTLTFDPESVDFEKPSQPDISGPAEDANDTPDLPDLEPDITPDLPPEDEDTTIDFREGLGDPCGINPAERCTPQSDTWPECTHATCEAIHPSMRCLRNLASLHGTCSIPCQNDNDCQGDPSNPFAQSMRCIDSAQGSWCRPGSHTSCETGNTCSPGESCKLVPIVSAEGQPMCQTDTPGGADTGAFCNEDPRLSTDLPTLCKNDLCLEDVCIGICNPSLGDSACDNPNHTCQTIRDDGTSMCLPKPCEGPSDCAPYQGQTPFCIPNDAGESTCRVDNPDAAGSRGLGEDCISSVDGNEDPNLCASRYCQGRTPFYTCSSLCQTHDDCGAEQLCAATRLRNPNTGEIYFQKQCAYARGSQSRCDDNNPCSIGENCAPFIFGDPVSDASVLDNAALEGRCVEEVPSGALLDSACANQICSAPGACILDLNEQNVCTTVCESARDCRPGQECLPVPFLSREENTSGETLFLGFCLYP